MVGGQPDVMHVITDACSLVVPVAQILIVQHVVQYLAVTTRRGEVAVLYPRHEAPFRDSLTTVVTLI